MDSKTVLVTGAAGQWGSRLVERLATDQRIRVIALDVDVPETENSRVKTIRTDVGNPLLADLFMAEKVDTVCHLCFIRTLKPSQSAFDVNVLGAKSVLEASKKARVRRIVIKSCTALYGAHADNSAFLGEDGALRARSRLGYIRDLLHVESLCRDYRINAPEMAVTVLRFANIVGPTADTPMTRYLNGRFVPVLLGFDPMMQIIHEDDVVEALAWAALNDVAGVFNVAAKDALPLGRVAALSDSALLPVFHPLAYWASTALAESLSISLRFPLDPDYLRYACVGDLDRMSEEFGFTPRFSAEETLRQFSERRESQTAPHG